MEKKIERSWVEISLPILIKNTQIYSYKTQDNSSIMAVVKADAYGHGAIEVSKTLQSIGIKNFAVSNVMEAVKLRNVGIAGQILVLGYTPVRNLDLVYEYDITQALISKDYADDVMTYGKKIKCQYAIDTGMHRIGLNADDITLTERAIRSAADNLNLTGLFTHLCVADMSSENKFTNLQQNKFNAIVESVKDLKLPYIHALNSAAGLWHHDKYSNLTRLGIIMYGLKPDFSNNLPEGIRPIMEWKSVISMIKEVYPGETIGYGRTFQVTKLMRIATIPTGYADGYNRSLSNRGYVLIHGKKAPIVGRICMDQFMVDVTDISEIKLYDEVVLIGKSGDEILTADDMAKMSGTIGYEIVCNIGKRVQRRYL